jgi:alpha-tubulin suppressor-like RCC1 family protein
VPVAVTATGVLSGVTLTQISAGGAYGVPFRVRAGRTGAAYCWGHNATGQVGNPATAANFAVPVAVTAAPTLIATGASHACLLRNGKAWCWGDNTYGELGINSLSPTQSTTPVAGLHRRGAVRGDLDPDQRAVTAAPTSPARCPAPAPSTAGG